VFAAPKKTAPATTTNRTTTKMKRNQSLILAAALAGSLLPAPTARAQSFTYNPSDLLLGFRNGGAYDFVVDLGPASAFYTSASQAPFTTFNITGYSGSQLTSVFGSLDNISFSVFGDVRSSTSAFGPLNTLWVTAPRMSLDVQSSPWSLRSTFQQANTGAKIDGIANGAVSYGASIAPDAVFNTPTALRLDSTWNASGVSYTRGMTAAGNFGGTFQGDVENTTPVGFASGGAPLQSDLYMMEPGSGDANELGYFTLRTDGSMTFTTIPEPSAMALAAAGFGMLLFRNHLRRRA
jgi:hypothetical protein